MKRILAIFGVIVLALAGTPGEAAGISSPASDGKKAGPEGSKADDASSASDREKSSSASASAENSKPADTGLVEKVRVTATRLPDTPEEASRIPAHVTVYTRKEIQASALRSDFVVFDEVGNGVESTADLRGFNTGSLATSALVVVDGVRLNEPDTGYVNFELIPLFDVERVEVIRGSSSALFGEGGLGGVINVVTRSGSDAARLEAALAGGSFSSKSAAVSSGGRQGKLSYHAGLGYVGSDGFRDNSGYRASSFAGRAEWQLTPNQSLGVDLTAETNHLDQPGALTAAELRRDREQSPFNKNDFSATDLYLPGVRYRLLRPGGFSLTSRLSFRDSAEDGFNGGRSGLGSQSEIDRMGLAWTIQAAQERSFGARSNQAVVGAEIARDRFDTAQMRTDSEGNPLPESDFSHSVSHADSTRRFLGLFLQDTFQFGPRFSVTGGVRFDRIRLASSGRQASYDFFAVPPVLTESETGGDRDFSQISPRLGVNFNPGEKTSLYAGYSRGFRAPTVIELFAFPIFFSNPDLDPVHSNDFEAGWSRRLGDRTTLSLNGFWIDVRDEIFFVLTDPSQFIGINLNLPRTRRRGAVFTAGTRLGRHFLGELGATYTDATFRTSFDDANIGGRVEKGDRLPQIPRLKYSAGLDVVFGGGWKAGVQDIYVERQILTSDLGNDAPQLSPYNVLNARISYGRDKWEGFLQADNVLDRRYSTRGIYAFNFSSFSFDQFYTPAPGRHFIAGATFRY
jgi:iron complex outermembrane recepter protein